MTKMFSCYLTFDVDYTNYVEQISSADEFSFIADMMIPFFEKNNICATWFVRIDNRMREEYGEPDYLLKSNHDVIQELKKIGHEIAWHPHCYVKRGDDWVQNQNELEVVEELESLLPVVKSYGIDVVRMGWAFHTNLTMRFINDNGFKIDSSAVPRPNYSWDKGLKDWSVTPSRFYHPSAEDYRIPGDLELRILEVPISTATISTPADTVEDVIRYINPAYHENYFSTALKSVIEKQDDLVTICHPYELQTATDRHHIISFNFEVFKKNIESLQNIAAAMDKSVRFKTISEAML